jgi:hypothetical protein
VIVNMQELNRHFCNKPPNFTLSTIVGVLNLSRPGSTRVTNKDNLLKLHCSLLKLLGKQVPILLNHFLWQICWCIILNYTLTIKCLTFTVTICSLCRVIPYYKNVRGQHISHRQAADWNLLGYTYMISLGIAFICLE